MSACQYCDKEAELRPYGKRGESICFECAMLPENKQTTEQQFENQLRSAGMIAVVGTQAGPFPLRKDKRQ